LKILEGVAVERDETTSAAHRVIELGVDAAEVGRVVIGPAVAR